MQNVGIKFNEENGKIFVDEFDMTNVGNIFAIGDVAVVSNGINLDNLGKVKLVFKNASLLFSVVINKHFFYITMMTYFYRSAFTKPK